MRKSGMLNNGRKAIVIMLFGLMAWFMACEKYSFDPPTIDPGQQVSFKTDIQPLFNNKCLACHGAGKNEPSLDAANSYESLTEGGYVNTGSPESSKLYTQMKSGPGHTSILTELQKQIILNWIKQGAENN